MRVITGSARGRRLRAMRGLAVRPTSDRVKGALFSMLMSRFDIERVSILDLFAGTGSLGIEALSRGAGRVVFVEQDRAASRVLESNVVACGFVDQSEILPIPVRRALRQLAAQGRRFEGVLVDPPYGHGMLTETLEQLGISGVLYPGGWAMAERHVDDAVAEVYGQLRLTETRRYGKTGLALFVVASEIDRVAAT